MRPDSGQLTEQEEPELQVQQAMAVSRWSYSTLVAIVATLVAAAFAVALVAAVDRPATSLAPTMVTLQGIGAEQIGHNRSEEGLTAAGSAGGEQVAHNRSEEGLTDR